MVNFVVCDDEAKYRGVVDKVVTSYMMKNEVDYQIHMFKDYDKEFLEMINKPLASKIYILDIENSDDVGY